MIHFIYLIIVREKLKKKKSTLSLPVVWDMTGRLINIVWGSTVVKFWC